MSEAKERVTDLVETSLPSGWAAATIGELVARDGIFIDGDWVESKDQDPAGDVRLVQLADVGDGEYRDKSARFLTSAKAAELGCTFLEPGDVLIARMPDPLGRACLFPGNVKPSVTVVDVCIVRTGSSGIDHKWLMYSINSPDFRSVVARLQSGTTRQRISRGNLAAIVLPVPPLAEQRRIVEAIEQQFTRLDAGVAALRRTQAALKRYRAAVLKAAVEGRLTEQWRAEHPDVEAAPVLLERILTERRARWEADLRARGKDPARARYEEPKGPDVGSLPELPEGWCWASLDQISILQRGRFSIRPRNDPRYYGGPHPFIQIGDIPDEGGEIRTYRQTLNEDGLKVSRMFSVGTVVVSIAAAIGTVGILTFASCFPDSIVGITCSDDVMARYVEIYLRTQRDQLKAKSYASGGQPNINLPVLQTYAIPLPSLAEQEQIVAEVERRLSVVGELEATVVANLKRAERLRQSILREAFAGRLVAQDASDEPAGVMVERIRGNGTNGTHFSQSVQQAEQGVLWK